jgi:hypothetical protein
MMPTPRPVGRYRPGAAWLAGVAGLAAMLVILASTGDASPRLEPPPASEPLRIGMNSCAARGCHGAVDSTDPGLGRVYIKDGAYTTWLNYDPHARAYAVLLEPRSVAIAKKLNADKRNRPLDDKPAHEAGLCLSCHSTAPPPESRNPGLTPLSDGISCEACHGPAEVWQDKHLSPAWRTLAHLPFAKDVDGMTNLSTPAARARLCVECHVGNRSRGMDMNHDLIAAGHPRLNFEFATYLASYPKHWREPHEKMAPGSQQAAASADFEAKSWAIGQVVTAGAVLDLLAARALASKEGAVRKVPAPEATWPEFSEYECFACHHSLTDPSPRQKPGHALGKLPWETWPSAILLELAKGRPGVNLAPWDELRAEMARPGPDPDKVAGLAALAKGQLDTLFTSFESEAFDGKKVVSLLKGLGATSPDVGESWDRAAQHELALQALARALKGLGEAVAPEVEAAIREGSKVLDFPANYDSPRNTSPPSLPKSEPRPGP